MENLSNSKEVQQYTHPMKWVIDKITDKEMMWVLFCQLNEVGIHNLLSFLKKYPDDIQVKWKSALVESTLIKERDELEKKNHEEYERSRR